MTHNQEKQDLGKAEEVVLLTGATGFVGMNILTELIGCGYRVVALSRKSSFPEIKAEWVRVQSGECEEIHEILNKYNISCVIHCAGRVNGTDAEIKNDNEIFTQSLVRAVGEMKKAIRFIFISSVSAIEASGAYGLSKRNSEKIIEDSLQKNRIILRPSLLYGKYDSKNVASLINLIQKFPAIPVPGKTGVKLQPLYVGDLSQLIVKILQAEEVDCKTYTVAGPRQEYLWDMIEIIRKELGAFCLRIPIPLWPLQKSIKILHFLLPFLNLPVQQIQSLHSHPPYESSEVAESFGFSPRLFNEGIQKSIGKS